MTKKPGKPEESWGSAARWSDYQRWEKISVVVVYAICFIVLAVLAFSYFSE